MGEETREQLDFFGASSKHRVDPVVQPQHVLDLGHALPANLHLGTSSWSFAGWEGIVYARATKTQQLSRRGLHAYARHPLLRSVGVDRSFYAPVRSEELAQYAAQVPDTFRFLVKAHGECTLARFGRNANTRAGQLNPRFLDPSYARDAVVQPFVEGLGAKAGVLLFQFSPQALAPLGGSRGLPERLHKFFEALPKLEQGHYAVELRNPELFTPRYLRALAEVGVQHCLNAMPNMQPLEVQYAASGGSQRDALVVR